MNELSLYTGIGGGIWGSKILGHRIVGYVEWVEYCQEVIKSRIRDGYFDDAPIFGDIRAFISSGKVDEYAGLVDLISGGFPYQPFSEAGKKKAEKDPRNMWPQTIEVIRRIKPKFVFLENVPRLLRFPYFGTILEDLETAGYELERPLLLGSSNVGAEHKKQRLWIFAGLIEGRLQEPRKKKYAEEFDIRMPQGKFYSIRCERNGPSIGPPVVRGLPRIPNRCDRIKGLGNCQVPGVAATAFRILSDGWI